MDRDDVIRMAREADCGHEAMTLEWIAPDGLERFAQLVAAQAAAEEREACARMADEYATWGGSNFYDWFKKLATAIRARGNA